MAGRHAAEQVKRIVREAGFDLCGIAPPGPVPFSGFVEEWLRRGYAGEMAFLHRHLESRRDVRWWLPWAESIIVTGLSYFRRSTPVPAAPPTRSSLPLPIANLRGRVAQYAKGLDYHRIGRRKLEAVVARLRDEFGPRLQTRICVDTSAILERSLALAAGIAWIGKNTMAIHPRLGSFFFLGEIVTNLDLPPDSPMPDRCGTCTRCLEACPTGAFPVPHVLDARRCIAYLTIEHRSEIDPQLADRMGDWVFGCDVCQMVCPYNRRAPETREPGFQRAAADEDPLLRDILTWTEQDYRQATRGRATRRAKLSMWRRNARHALRNASAKSPTQGGSGQT